MIMNKPYLADFAINVTSTITIIHISPSLELYIYDSVLVLINWTQ